MQRFPRRSKIWLENYISLHYEKYPILSAFFLAMSSSLLPFCLPAASKVWVKQRKVYKH